MTQFHRRDLFRMACAAAAGIPSREASTAEIHRLLGFTTMSGEDPLTLWKRLRPAKEWLAGPLAPDGWAGQVFVADHADIFGFRFLSLPQAWAAELPEAGPAAGCAGRFKTWMQDWPKWWTGVGPKAPDDSYARLDWQMPEGGPAVTYEWARTAQNEVVCRITNSAPAAIVLEGYVPWDSAPPRYAVLFSSDGSRRFLRARSWVPGTRDAMRWVLAVSRPAADCAGAGSVLWHGYYPGVEKLYLCARQGQRYEELEEQTEAWLVPGRIDELLGANRRRYVAARPEGRGWLADVPAAINDQLQWSEVYTPERRRAYITVSRSWARDTNSAPDFLWDSFFSALLVSQEDPRRAFQLIRDITSWQNEQGMFAQYGQWPGRPKPSEFPVAWGHTQYPIGALAVAKTYLRHPDGEFLAEIYPKLLKAHRWWFADRGDGQPWRDGNRNGLLELGANYPEEIPVEHREQVAYYESHDDSPQWWRVARYNSGTNTIEQDTVERNSLYAMDCWVLAWMAERLKRPAEAARLRAEHAAMAKRINRLLWNPATGCYANRRWVPNETGEFFPQMAPDVFLSLLGRVPTPERAEHLRRLFHDPNKFAGQFILPTISRDDAAFPQQHYWRGKVWAPINWLVYQGFKLQGWDREARMLAESSARMFLGPWRSKGHCYENFLSTTGEGSSDPHYTWGALMVLIAVEELIDVNPFHGLRFGNLHPVEPASIRRYPVAGALYDVELSDEGLRVQRDGRRLVWTDGPAEIRFVEFEGNVVRCEVRAARPVEVRLGSSAAVKLPAGVSRVTGAI